MISYLFGVKERHDGSFFFSFLFTILLRRLRQQTLLSLQKFALMFCWPVCSVSSYLAGWDAFSFRFPYFPHQIGWLVDGWAAGNLYVFLVICLVQLIVFFHCVDFLGVDAEDEKGGLERMMGTWDESRVWVNCQLSAEERRRRRRRDYICVYVYYK